MDNVYFLFFFFIQSLYSSIQVYSFILSFFLFFLSLFLLQISFAFVFLIFSLLLIYLSHVSFFFLFFFSNVKSYFSSKSHKIFNFFSSIIHYFFLSINTLQFIIHQIYIFFSLWCVLISLSFYLCPRKSILQETIINRKLCYCNFWIIIQNLNFWISKS